MNDSKLPKHTNRLAKESSPYLLQHAHNPVDWYAWGAQAFEASRKENKPIFLSVGYSTCYWCHVMERQCFENEDIAAEMNQRFINIKVDREERPDVDQLYMTAVQVLTRHGGWPMSVFLTPDLRPFYGGTYFPPTDMHGRPGFVTILRAIEEAYRDRPSDVEKTANQLVSILAQYAQPAKPQAAITIDEAFVEELIRRSVSDYDARFGGFGGAPKFPRETLLELLLVYSGMGGPPMSLPAKLQDTGGPPVPRNFKSKIPTMLRHTLDALADGGIRDQLGGGFHRYSTDERWLVPHFEIMLYDNAMLAWCYVEAYRQFGESRYAMIARGIFDFVLREMTSPDGGFYTAMDAEVDGQEGLNYLWTAPEIVAILGEEDARTFNAVYGVERGPNFADPHHGSGIADKNILFFPIPLAQAAEKLKLQPAQLESRLTPMREKLYQARMKRKQPLLDTKIITSWNALMIRALAHGGKVLGDSLYIDAAIKAAKSMLSTNCRSESRLYRTSRDGNGKYDAFLDDYAFLAQSLLALNDATGDPSWREAADKIGKHMIDEFGDRDRGGFYFTEKDAADLIIRQKTATDSPLPSGNAVAAMVLLELGQIDNARNTLNAFAQQMESQGEGMGSMVQAALLYCREIGGFTVSPHTEQESGARPSSPRQLAERVVATTAQWQSPSELIVHVSIQPGYHINAHNVPADLSLIATRVMAADDPNVEVEYPAGEEMKADFSDRPIRVYSGEIQIRVRFSKPQQGQTPVKLNFTYQACNETSCLPPMTIAIVA